MKRMKLLFIISLSMVLISNIIFADSKVGKSQKPSDKVKINVLTKFIECAENTKKNNCYKELNKSERVLLKDLVKYLRKILQKLVQECH